MVYADWRYLQSPTLALCFFIEPRIFGASFRYGKGLVLLAVDSWIWCQQGLGYRPSVVPAGQLLSGHSCRASPPSNAKNDSRLIRKQNLRQQQVVRLQGQELARRHDCMSETAASVSSPDSCPGGAQVSFSAGHP